ncbi:hypothetical protein CFC21_105518 [Triticum aestivum]|uniref:Uncharacterized protein n=3 Tax=Triticum aestivum TaxID=4565 RepID=A0A3B6SNY6_WHEAT|nr:hypothetical protein CFC21_105518 [Triticum aestivum]
MEQVDIWAPILADPLPSQQAEIKVHLTYVDYGTMDFQALLEGPHDLDRWLKGEFIPTYIKEANLTHENERKFYSPTSDHGMTIQTPMPEKEEAPATTTLNTGGEEEEMREGRGAILYPPPCHRRSRRLAATATPPEKGTCDLLDYIPNSGWRHGRRVRSGRERGTWWINIAPCSRDLHASEGQTHRSKRNNDHWTSEEVKELVDGVSVYGVGPWTKLKNERFPISVRTAVHLKDKWRNLVKAVTGNEKRRITPRLDKDCVEKIKRLAADYPRE